MEKSSDSNSFGKLELNEEELKKVTGGKIELAYKPQEKKEDNSGNPSTWAKNGVRSLINGTGSVTRGS